MVGWLERYIQPPAGKVVSIRNPQRSGAGWRGRLCLYTVGPPLSSVTASCLLLPVQIAIPRPMCPRRGDFPWSREEVNAVTDEFWMGSSSRVNTAQMAISEKMHLHNCNLPIRLHVGSYLQQYLLTPLMQACPKAGKISRGIVDRSIGSTNLYRPLPSCRVVVDLSTSRLV